MKKIAFLNRNAIKLLAALFMTLDHIGLFFDISVLRYVGRLAFPLFAFVMAEGCRYTKSKTHHFALLFGFGVLFQTVYTLALGHSASLYNVFLTFSVSAVLIYVLDYAKACSFAKEKKPFEIAVAWLFFAAAILSAYTLSTLLHFDYLFCGMLFPLLVSLPNPAGEHTPAWLLKLDKKWIRICLAAVGMLLLAIEIEQRQPGSFVLQCFAFFALVPLALYNGKKGKRSLKYFFYFFYPLHMVFLWAIYMLIEIAKLLALHG